MPTAVPGGTPCPHPHPTPTSLISAVPGGTLMQGTHCNLQYQVVHSISNPLYPPTSVPGGTPYSLPHIFNICSTRWNAIATCITRWYAVFPTPVSLYIFFSAGWHTDTNHNTRWYAALWTLTPLYICRARWYTVIICNTGWYAVLPIPQHPTLSTVPGGTLMPTSVLVIRQFIIPISPAVPDGSLICQIQYKVACSTPNPNISLQYQVARCYQLQY